MKLTIAIYTIASLILFVPVNKPVTIIDEIVNVESVEERAIVKPYKARLKPRQLTSQPKSKKTVVARPVQPQPTGSKADWMRRAGISDLYHANLIVNKESSWRVGVINRIGCIGLIQACPAGLGPVMKSNCPNWATDPVCQLKVAQNYMKSRYGTWSNAWQFHIKNNWW